VSADATIGGQAVPDGVMLRGRAGWAVAVRRPDGSIAVADELRRAPARFWTRPLLRGLHAVGGALPLGMRAMARADQLRHLTAPPPPTVRARLWFLCSLGFAIALAAALFGWLPAWTASTVGGGPALDHTVEPLVRTAMIVAYIVAVGLLPEVRRVFAYHGAEHQVVAAHEMGISVDAVSARNFSRFHPRCGTTFVLLVALLEGLLHAAVPLPSSALVRLVEVPLAIALAYELLHLAISSPGRMWARVVLAPGRGLQRLTTRPPDHGQLEVACAALAAVLRLEDQDQQQDDQDQDDNSTADVHRASLRKGHPSVSAMRRAETP
jgi:uncharacterized protein YqhQ